MRTWRAPRVDVAGADASGSGAPVTGFSRLRSYDGNSHVSSTYESSTPVVHGPVSPATDVCTVNSTRSAGAGAGFGGRGGTTWSDCDLGSNRPVLPSAASSAPSTTRPTAPRARRSSSNEVAPDESPCRVAPAA